MTATPDVRYGLRLLVRSPVFAVTAVLSLAAGIAGTASIYSLADALLLRPRVGITDPSTLVDIGRTTRGQGLDNFSYPLFEAMRAGTTQLDAIAAHQLSPQVMSLGDAHASERVFAALVSGNYFEVAGTRTARGRFFLPEEDLTSETHPVVVLNHEFWVRRFGAREDIVGSTLRLNSRPYTVVGIAEEGFSGTTFLGADLWVPMAMDAHVRAAEGSLRTEERAVWLTALGRLRPGATIPQARDELRAIMTNHLKARGDARIETWGVAVEPSARVPAPLAAPVGGFVGALALLTGLVLLIACSNVAGMLIARGLERRREFATRLAVGASRAQLIRQLLLEGCLLALVASGASVPLTYLLVGMLAAWQPSLPIPLSIDLRVDLGVLGVAFALAALAALGFSLLPALQTTRVDVAPALRGAHASADRRRVWLRQALVIGQVAVALVLLVSAGLFLRSLQEAAHANVGFNPRDVDTLQIDTRIAGYATDAEGIRVLETLLERFRNVPGVSSAGASRMVPLLSGSLGLGALRAPGYVGPDGTDGVAADWNVVSTGFFETLQTPVVQGRPFGPQDREGAPSVAIVNQTMAASLWPGQDPIGRTIFQRSGRDEERPLHVVGIAADGKYRSVSEPPRNYIYVPMNQQFMSEITFYVRRAPGASRVNELRQAIAAFDPMLPVIHTTTLEEATSLVLLPQRLAAWIAGSVGAIGLFLAALGVYGLIAFSVTQRRREIAIRMAVGAPQGAIVWLVLRQAAVLAAAGAAIGLVLAAGVSTLLRSFLVGLGAIDPVAFSLALVLLTAVMVLSAWAPARRAATTDPVTALRLD